MECLVGRGAAAVERGWPWSAFHACRVYGCAVAALVREPEGEQTDAGDLHE